MIVMDVPVQTLERVMGGDFSQLKETGVPSDDFRNEYIENLYVECVKLANALVASFMYVQCCTNRPRTLSSDAVLAETSLRSPQKIFIFIIQKNLKYQKIQK